MSTMADLWPRWLHDADRVGDPGHAGPRRRRGAHARQVFTPGRCLRPAGVYARDERHVLHLGGRDGRVRWPRKIGRGSVVIRDP